MECKTCAIVNEVKSFLDATGRTKDALLPCLKAVQAKHGVISKEAIGIIGNEFGLKKSDVHGVATFYGMLTTEKVSKYVIRVCENLSCHITGAHKIIETLEHELGLKAGNSNNLFTLEAVECLGMCDEAPAMLINEEPYGNLTVEKVKAIIKKYKEAN